jgi:nucleotide-binding universal stress UspA family protein
MTEIVVGVDGSESGARAVSWALDEAVLRGLPVRLVHVMPRWAFEMPETGRHAAVGRWAREEASDLLTRTWEDARRQKPSVEVVSQLLPGDPRTVLLTASTHEAMLVVGSHGTGGFSGMLLGSVAAGVAGRASCPVVVVRHPPQIADSGEIVVGVDGSLHSRAALEMAYAEAACRSGPVRAVYAWRKLTGAIWDRLPFSADAAALYGTHRNENDARRMLAEAIAGLAERYPDVKLVEQVEHGHPVDVLIQASTAAELLVVGHRAGHAVAGLTLGSVARGVLHHARCPVAIVPAHLR